MDIAMVVIYLLGMIAFGFWGKSRATTQSDFLVAGRRLGPRCCTPAPWPLPCSVARRRSAVSVSGISAGQRCPVW